MSPSKPSNSIKTGLINAIYQERNFKLALTNMLKDLKEDMNKSLNVICENKNELWNEIMKTVQDMKMK